MTAPRRETQPNVVLIISDQQRADTIARRAPGARAAAGVQTPHLDWLAQRGTLFRNAYCASPTCSPARATILTGLYPHTTGLIANNQPRPIARDIHLSPDVSVLADYLKPAGYACAYFGKWHLGTGGDRRGFDAAVTRSGAHEVDGPEQNDVLHFLRRLGIPAGGKQKGLEPDPETYDRRIGAGPSLLPLAFHPSMLHAQGAAQFIRQRQDNPQPFALVYSCHEPHPPFTSPRPFATMYSSATNSTYSTNTGPIGWPPLPESRRDTAGRRRVEERYGHPRTSVSAFGDDELRAMWAAYYGAVSYVDHLVGIILAALIDADQIDTTLFVFTSDHGEFLGAHDMLGKCATFYEELVNVPLLIVPPGGRLAHETTQLVSHADLVPTILRWCGTKIVSGLHGADIRPLVEGQDTPVRDGVAFEYHSGNWGDRLIPLRGWRTQEWKYVEATDGTDELYDLRSDRQETRNLIGDAGRVGIREQMKAALHDWMAQTGDSWPDVPVPPNRRVEWRYAGAPSDAAAEAIELERT